jgi:hypothetical protein
MRCKWATLTIMALMLGATGCATSDIAAKPVKELFVDNGNLGDVESETERIWFVDEPTHITPEIVHGGIQ